ncbi:uncharacterized protein CLUP02_11911 [Colletotrichum lupini]|uniref:Uncharacterized protein n=1 Tax=Colletotrichum lupini TaxID=145971 RepID=A0A9Q8T0A2_9PEZI|nr:uncharacterized protein CLUP02_11911 [Colletotrichum lupini]UQC86410.1 hypothetical protein CLUP02_11911 [Colletotrichum lupini]
MAILIAECVMDPAQIFARSRANWGAAVRYSRQSTGGAVNKWKLSIAVSGASSEELKCCDKDSGRDSTGRRLTSAPMIQCQWTEETPPNVPSFGRQRTDAEICGVGPFE